MQRALRTPSKNGRTSEEGCGECLVGRVAGTLSDGFGIAALFFADFDGVTVSGFGLYLLVYSLSGEVM